MSSDSDSHSDKNSTTSNDEKATRALTRKIDWHLMPLVSAIYLLSYLVRSNISNAKLGSLEEDTHLTTEQYQWTLSIFFFGYVIIEVPSNIVLRRWRASRWIALLLALCGITGLCMAFAKNFASLLVCRFFLGVFEAGLFPGLIYYTSLWYPKKQQAIRFGIFWSFSALAGAFGGAFAYGITQIPTSALADWQLLFIIEGAPTVALAIVCWFLLPDSPEKTTFLTDDERQMEIDRLANDDGAAESDSFSWAQVRSVFTDWKTYVFSLIYITGTIPLQGVSLFLPTLVEDLGHWTDLESQLMIIPPYMAGFFAILLISRSSDYFTERSFHLLATNLLAICGLFMLIFLEEKRIAGLYAGMILFTAGVYANVSIKIAWFNNNFASLTRRAVASALIVSLGTVGGAISGQIYHPKQKPRYVIGNTVALVCVLVQTVLIVLLRIVFQLINRRRDRLDQEEAKRQVEQYGDEEIVGDRHPDFRYTL